MKYYHYYRNLLPSRLHVRYDVLLEAMRKAGEEISVPFGYVRHTNLVQDVLYDRPDIFYYTFEYRFNPGLLSTRYFMNYAVPKDQAKGMIDVMKEKIRKEFGPARSLGEYERVIYVVKWFEKNVRYDQTYPDCYTMAGPLLRHQGVCQGISLLICFVLGYFDMDVFMVTGDLLVGDKKEPHAWNAVKIDGHWVYLDMTNSLDGGKSYICVSEKRLKGYEFTPPKDLDFSYEGYDFFNITHTSFNTPQEAGAALTKLLRNHDRVPLRLEVNDENNHFDEICAATSFNGTLGALFRLDAQTYLFTKGQPRSQTSTSSAPTSAETITPRPVSSSGNPRHIGGFIASPIIFLVGLTFLVIGIITGFYAMLGVGIFLLVASIVTLLITFLTKNRKNKP